MASPGQLVDAVSRILGVPRATVALHDRNLAVAGLRKMGGRGPSAAVMDSVDAANLLIAVVAAPINGPAVVSSAAACELYSNLTLGKESTSLRRWRDAKILRLAAPSSSRTFRDLLVSLIDAERAGELEESMRGTRFWHFLFSVRAPFPYVEVVFDVPDIHIELRYGDDVPEQEAQADAWYSARLKKFQAGDLGQTRWFTHLTIREIGTLLGK